MIKLNKINILILVVSLLIIFLFSTIYNLQTAHESHSKVVDIAGRNRMLSQQIGYELHKNYHSNNISNSNLEKIEESIILHDKSLDVLTYGGLIWNGKNEIYLSEAPTEVFEYLNKSKIKFIEYKKYAIKLLENLKKGKKNKTLMNYINNNNKELLLLNQNVVESFVTFNEKSEKKIKFVLIIIFLITLIGITYIFKLIKLTEKQNKSIKYYNKNLSKKVKEKTKEILKSEKELRKRVVLEKKARLASLNILEDVEEARIKVKRSLVELKGLDKLKVQFSSI